jgi:hypothetical protein
MWRVGPRPQHTAFAELNAAPVVPDGLPQWPALMDSWGSKMLAAVEAAAEMAALGFGLPRDAFSSLMRLGPHLLAPTGADLQAHGQPGAVIAGYHYDLNFVGGPWPGAAAPPAAPPAAPVCTCQLCARRCTCPRPCPRTGAGDGWQP